MSLLHKRCESMERTLLRRIHDLESDLKEQAERYQEEREKLLDKILSMANPAAVREYRRIPMESMETIRHARELASGNLKEIKASQPRSSFPGYPGPPRPPVVNPPTRPHKGITSPTDFNKAVAQDVQAPNAVPED